MLLEKTKELLAATDHPREDIASKAGVGYSWLCKFEKDKYANPGVVSVQKLHDYLKTIRKRKK